ncbi:hypothetical protein ABI_09860 [Asticcacaulis biprosthecium C19]|uniref:Uncharacterized protein n=2 Tax=Asticcacaulis biprosthecium TaxID=76891 RepID=F4QGU7_9CAUL|nr:hypothetical protein ABI_09860 [Asticcacaulis biprosthecium C19]
MTPLEVSLARIVAAAPDTDDWWLIGSVAARLSGIDLEPQDVDVLGSRTTIEAFARNLGGGVVAGSGSERFRSTPFVRIEIDGGLPVELMGDLHVNSGGWTPLRVKTRVALTTAAGTVYAPSLAEQADIFEAFGRHKDLTKARLIRM